MTKTPLCNYIITTILIFFNAIMLIFPKEILIGAKNGLLLWYNNVLPSLFPFMVFTGMLVATDFPSRLGRLLAPFMQRLFGLSGEGAFAVAVGLIAGCPLGAKTVCDLFTRGSLNKSEAQRLVALCNNTGPLFVVGAVGSGMLGDGRIGLKLLVPQYTAALVMLAITGLGKQSRKPRQQEIHNNKFELGTALTASVTSAVNAVVLVGGFIALFSVICTILKTCGILNVVGDVLSLVGMDKNSGVGLVIGALEVTNGVACAVKGGSLALIGALIAWGGLSIHAQSSAFIVKAGLSCKKYLLYKLVQAIIAYMVGVVMFGAT
jgi:sporulation integral membrane protein YlbJ